jgi:hypothetical protein
VAGSRLCVTIAGFSGRRRRGGCVGPASRSPRPQCLGAMTKSTSWAPSRVWPRGMTALRHIGVFGHISTPWAVAASPAWKDRTPRRHGEPGQSPEYGPSKPAESESEPDDHAQLSVEKGRPILSGGVRSPDLHHADGHQQRNGVVHTRLELQDSLCAGWKWFGTKRTRARPLSATSIPSPNNISRLGMRNRAVRPLASTPTKSNVPASTMRGSTENPQVTGSHRHVALGS